jgi:hypothetical protein
LSNHNAFSKMYLLTTGLLQCMLRILDLQSQLLSNIIYSVTVIGQAINTYLQGRLPTPGFCSSHPHHQSYFLSLPYDYLTYWTCTQNHSKFLNRINCKINSKLIYPFPNRVMQADRLCEHLKAPKMSLTYLSQLKDPKTVVSICGAYLLLNLSTVPILTPVHAARVVIPLAL